MGEISKGRRGRGAPAVTTAPVAELRRELAELRAEYAAEREELVRRADTAEERWKGAVSAVELLKVDKNDLQGEVTALKRVQRDLEQLVDRTFVKFDTEATFDQRVDLFVLDADRLSHDYHRHQERRGLARGDRDGNRMPHEQISELAAAYGVAMFALGGFVAAACGGSYRAWVLYDADGSEWHPDGVNDGMDCNESYLLLENEDAPWMSHNYLLFQQRGVLGR